MIRMPLAALSCGLAASLVAAPALAAEMADVMRVPAPGGFPISSLVIAPAGATIVYVSGTTTSATSPGGPLGDTKTQTVGALTKIGELLAKQGMSLADVAMMRVYLVADPSTGKMDFPGMMAGYTQFFGTPAQPNKPSRTTVQVAGLALPGGLVEIEVQAVKVK